MYCEAASVQQYCSWVSSLIEGTTVPFEASRDREGRNANGRRASTTPAGSVPVDTRRKWRHAYPREVSHDEVSLAVDKLRQALLGSTYCEQVPTTFDEGRRSALQRDAEAKLRAWVVDHGSADRPNMAACIGTPADLMMAFLNSSEAVESVSDEEDQQSEMWDALLQWISDKEGHEVDDYTSRGRLVTLHRLLDVDHDGRVSAADICSALKL